MTVDFETANWAVGGKGEAHIHFQLDDGAQRLMFYNGSDNVVELDEEPGATPLAAWIDADTIRINGLRNGSHAIRARLAGPDHTPEPNPEAEAVVGFIVGNPDAAPPAFSQPEVSEDGSTFVDASNVLGTDDDVTARVTLQDAGSGIDRTVHGLAATGDMLGLWRMENDWLDSSSRGNHGVPSGGAMFSSDAKAGEAAARFDGSDDSLTLPQAAHAAGSVTLEAWFRSKPFPPSEVNGRRLYESDMEILWSLLDSGRIRFMRYKPGAGWIALDSEGTVGLNTWHHTAATYDADTGRWAAYIDGRPSGSMTDGFEATSVRYDRGPVRIGAQPWLLANCQWNGTIDEFAIYDRALSPQEISEHYRRGAGYRARYSKDGGETWISVPPEDLSLEPAPGGTSGTDPHFMTAAGLDLAPSAAPGTNRIEFAAQDLAGNPGSIAFDILTPEPDTTPPAFSQGDVSEDGVTFLDASNTLTTKDGISARVTVQDAGAGLDPSGGGLVPSGDMLGFWRMDNDWEDSSGRGNHGSPLDGATFSPDSQVGAAAGSFDGSDDSVTLPDTAHVPGSVTMETWFRSNPFPPSEVNGRRLYESGNGILWSLLDNGKVHFMRYKPGVGWTPLDSAGTASVGEWHHTAATYDAATGVWAAYIDGEPSGSMIDRFDATAFDPGPGPIRIGAQLWLLGNCQWNGLIDEFSIHERALSAEEVAAHYRRGFGHGARYTKDGGESWTRVPYANLAMAPVSAGASATDPHYLTATGLDLAPSAAQSTNQIEFTASDRDGNLGTYALNILTPPPDTAPPAFSQPEVSEDGSTFLDASNTLTTDDGISARVTLVDSYSGLPPNAGAVFPEIDGTVALWQFEEASGATAEDSSGSGNHGSLVSSPARVAGRHGRALSFNGADQVVQVADSPSLAAADQLTVEFWYKPNGTDAWLTKGNGVDSMSVNEWLVQSCGAGSSGSQLYVNIGGSWRTSPCTAGVTPGQWNHLAWTYDGDKATAYRNGVPTGSSSWGHSDTPIRDGNGLVGIGYDARYPIGTPGRMMNGAIDEIRILNVALSAEQVLREYQAESGLSGRFTADGGETWQDISSSDIDLKPVSPGASRNDPFYLTASGLDLAPSAGPRTNRVELSASDLEGNAAAYAFDILTPPPPSGPLLEDDFNSGALDASKWLSDRTGSAAIDFPNGVLKLATGGGNYSWRGAALFSKETFQKAGVYQLDLEWKPGTKASTTGQIPGIYFRDPAATRDDSTRAPTNRYIRLDLGSGADHGEQRTVLTLYGRGAGGPHTLKSVTLAPPVAAEPAASAMFHHIRIELDFGAKTFSLKLDGLPLMTDVDLTQDSGGAPIDFLGDIADFHVELYGGGQYMSSSLAEYFDGVLLQGPPQVRLVSPASAPAGRELIVSGRGFGETQGSGGASLGGSPMTVTSWTDLQIVAPVPSGLALGPQDLAVATDDGRASLPWLFTITDDLPTLFSDGFAGSAPDWGKWSQAKSGSSAIEVSDGRLSLKTEGGNYSRRGVALFTKPAYKKAGVYHLNLDWRPGTKASSTGQIPAVYIRDAGASRDGTLQSPSDRYLRLDVGSSADHGERRTVLGLYGRGTGSVHTIKSVTLPSPVLGHPNAAAVFHRIHLALDFDANTLSMELDGRAVMSGVDLTLNSAGSPIDVLDAIGSFQVELFGGAQYMGSSLRESFDNVSLAGPPQIHSLEPGNGPVGAELTLAGAGFGEVQGSGSVSLESADPAVPRTALTVTRWSDTEIVAAVPAGTSAGARDLVVLTGSGQESFSVRFTVTEPLPLLLIDEFEAASLDGAQWRIASNSGQGRAEVADGVLKLRTDYSSCCPWRGVGAYSVSRFGGQGVYHLSLDWLPGTKSDGNGQIPGIFFRSVDTTRHGAYHSPDERYVRLDLGSNSNTGSTRTELTLRGKGPYGAMEHLIKQEVLTTPILAAPSSNATSHRLHITLDFASKSFSLDLDGQPVMSDVPLMSDSGGNPIDFLDSLGEFQVELYGGSQLYGSGLIETFDNVRLEGPPQLLALSRGSGPSSTELTLMGNGFGAGQGSGYVRLGGNDLLVVGWADDSIVVRIPEGTPLGPQDIALKAELGPELGGFQFTVTETLPLLLIDDFEMGTLHPDKWRSTSNSGNARVEVADGFLKIRTDYSSCCPWRGAAAYSVAQFRREGVYHLNFNWKPGTKSDVNGRIPGVYFRTVAASRDGSQHYPQERYIRLDLGKDNDNGAFRTELSLHGKGPSGTTAHLLERVPMSLLLPTEPSPNATVHQVHIALDFADKTFSLDLDGRPIMAGVDLTRDSGGAGVDFLDSIGKFQVEFFGGAQVYGSGLIEKFDNVTFEGPPQFHALSRGSGPSGTELTLTGSGFGASQGSGYVRLGGNDIPVMSWSDGEVTVRIPEGSPLGTQAVVLKAERGPEVGGFRFTVTETLPLLLSDDFQAGALDTDKWRATSNSGNGRIEVGSGLLRIRTDYSSCCPWRGAAAYSVAQFRKEGVYHVNLNWKPGKKADGNGRVPGIYFRTVAASREGSQHFPLERYIRLDLGKDNDNGAFRTELGLYGRGPAGSAPHLLKKVPIGLLLATDPHPDATVHQIHITLNLADKTFSLDLDGQAMMTDVDLTRDSTGAGVDFLDSIGMLQLELYGGAQYYGSGLIETFDNVTVEGPPQFHALSRGSGAPGTEVTLRGSGFGDNRLGGYVRLGGNDLTVLSWSDDAVRVRVPQGTSFGTAGVVMKADIGPEVGGLRFTVTPVLAVLLTDDFQAVSLDAGKWRTASNSGNGRVEVTGGSLRLRTDYPSCCPWRGVAAYSVAQFDKEGLYHLNLDWKPGTKADGNGRVPGIYLRTLAASREGSQYFSQERFIRLDLGKDSDNGAFRTELGLYGRGPAASAPYLVKKVPIGLLLATDPSPDATVHQIHIALDFANKTLSVDLDGQAMMTDVDLTRASDGTAIDLLGSIGKLQVELYGGAQYYGSGLTESFDNVLLEGPPQLRSVRPNFGPPGTEVEIAGVGFGDTRGTGGVSLGAQVLSVTSWSDTSVTAVLPPGAPAGAGSLSVTSGYDQSSRDWLFTVTGPLLTVLEDDFNGFALDADNWEAIVSGPASAQVAGGVLNLRTDYPSCCPWRSALVYSKSQFGQQGVYHLDLDWKPGTKSDGNGDAPGLFFHSPESNRHGTFRSPDDRHLRLDLGRTNDNGPIRTRLGLYGKGASGSPLHTLKTTDLAVPIATATDPDADFQRMHVALDFENKTFSLELDGRAIMTNVDLTKNNSGGAIDFLDTLGDFKVELFGGAQYYGSALVESFDNPSIMLADISVPVAQITSHAENAFVAGLVTVSGTAADEGGINGTEFFIDGAGQGAAEPPAFSFEWDTLAQDAGGAPLYADGPHEVYLQARDSVGNVGASPTVTVQVDNTPPVTSLGLGPNGTNGWYKSPMPTLTLSAADGPGVGAGEVRFSVDEGPETTTTGASAQPGVPEGTHVLSYFAVDQLGNQEDAKSATFHIDLRAPAAPGNPRTTLVEERRVELAWDASADAEGPDPSGTALYRISRRVYEGGAGFSVIADTPTLAYHDTQGLALGETYEYRLQAVDAAGNASVPADLAVFVPDLTPPELSNVSAALSEDETRIDVSWDSSELTTGQVAVGTEPGLYTSTTPAEVDPQDIEQLSRELLTAVEGLDPHTTYYLRAVSIDAFGNQAASEEFTVITDTHPPTLAITAPEAGAAANTDLIIEYTVSDDLTPEESISVRDDQGHDAPPFTFTDDGERTVILTATDAAGNAATASIAFTIDKSGPARIGDLAVAEQRPADGEADLAWTAPSDALGSVAGYVLKSHSEPLDDENWDEAVSHAAPSPSEPGAEESHTVTDLPAEVAYLAIRSQDELGNLSAVSNSVLYDPAPPEVAITAPEAAAVLSRPYAASVTASDSQGIVRVDFLVDGEVAGTDTSPPYEFSFDIRDYPDGAHTLTARALDGFGNSGETTIPVTISYNPPPAPVIEVPQEGFLTATPGIDVSGTAEPSNSVSVYVNGYLAETAAVPANGSFLIQNVLLGVEGAVTLTARTFDSKGTSQPSAPVNGTLDTGPPGPPAQVTAASQSGGRIQVSWDAPQGETPTSYKLYRSNLETDLAEGEAPPPSALIYQGSGAGHTDTPPHDGLFFYGTISQDAAANVSGLSNIAAGVSDRVSPSASLRLTQSVPPLGPGDHPLEVTFSEFLALPPVLTLTPQGQGPATIQLDPETGTVWVGTLTVTAAMNSGTATFGFSGRDFVGNNGSTLTSGRTVVLDTRGPSGSVTFPAIVPTGNYPLTLRLDEPAADTPALSFTPTGKPAVPVALSAAGPDNQDWTASVAIDETTGDGEAAFTYSAEDALGNLSATLSGGITSFIIDTIAPGPPTFVRAIAQQGGVIQLSWSRPDAGELPATYRVFRDGEQLSPAVAPSPDGSGSFADIPSDGPHDYEVASVDAAGNQTKSAVVPAAADSTPPDAPSDLTAQLDTSLPGATRVRLSFRSYPDSESFNIYRALSPIASIAGLTPVLVGQFATAPDGQGLRALFDIPTSDGVFYYAVTALDTLDNESDPSNSSEGVLYDKAAPVIAFSIQDGAFFKADVSPLFTVTDANLDPASVQGLLDGAAFESGTPVSAEGEHILAVSAQDVEGHSAEEQIRFTLDKTPPEIQISGIAEGSTSNDPVAIEILPSDLHLDATTYTLLENTSGASEPYDSGELIGLDGSYTLGARATDKAGNITLRTFSFSLDLSPRAPTALDVSIEGGVASLTWSAADTDIVGYRVYRDGMRISPSLVPQASYQDNAYTGGAAHLFEVEALDTLGQVGARAGITIPPVSLELAAYGVSSGGQQALTRGFFDTVRMQVTNLGGQGRSFGPLELRTVFSGHEPFSRAVSAAYIQAGQSAVMSGTVASAPDLPASGQLQATLTLPTEPGTSARLSRRFAVAARSPQGTIIELFPEPLVRETQAKVKVKFNNRGSAPLDIKTARMSGGSPVSVPDVIVELLTPQGLVVSQGEILQAGNGAQGAIVGGQQVFFVTVPAGSSVLLDPVSVLVPDTAEDSLLVKAKVAEVAHSLPFNPVAGTRSFESTQSQAAVTAPPYTADASADKDVYERGEAATVTGTARDASGQPRPAAKVKVHAQARGFELHFDAFTDSQGVYSVQFVPPQPGVYSVSASHPEVVTYAAQDTFSVIDFGLQYTHYTVRLAQNSTYRFHADLINDSETPLQGLTSEVHGSTPTLSVTLDPDSLPDTLLAGARTSLSIDAHADPSAPVGTSQIDLVVREQNGFERTMPVIFEVSQALAYGKAAPQSLEIGMLAGETREQSITLQNTGFDDWRNVRLTLPTVDFVELQSQSDLGDISPNGTSVFGLRFAPPAGLPSQTIRQPLLEVRSDNVPTIYINAGITITTSREGSLTFNVINADKPKDPVTGQGVGVPNALVVLNSNDISGLTFRATADLNGVARFEDIPAGDYSWNAQSSGFLPDSGIQRVEPGLTQTVVSLLRTATVTYEWSVTPTTIVDEYVITLNATFKTDVPAPVIEVTPTSFELYQEGGQTSYVQFTITNKGLVSAFDVDLSGFQSDGAIQLEPAFTHIAELKAQESVVVPVKVNLVSASCHNAAIRIIYYYLCAFGVPVSANAPGVGFTAGTSCGSSSPGRVVHRGGGGGGGGGGSGGGGGGVWGHTPPSVPFYCGDTPPDETNKALDDCLCDGIGCADIDWEEMLEEAFIEPFGGNWIYEGPEMLTRPMDPSLMDSLKFIPMFNSKILKEAENLLGSGLGAGWSHNFNSAVFMGDSGAMTYVNPGGGQKLFQPAVGGKVFVPPLGASDAMSVVQTAPDGTPEILELTRPNGQATRFDKSGTKFRPTLITSANGSSTELAYSAGKLIEARGSSGDSLSFEYDTQDRLHRVATSDGRAQTFDYGSNGDMLAITTPEGREDTFGYDTDHRMTSIAKGWGGRSMAVAYDSAGRVSSLADSAGSTLYSVSYDTAASKTVTTDASGNQKTFEYVEKSGRKALASVTGDSAWQPQVVYDDQLNKTAITGPSGSTTRFTYDTRGNVTSATDPKGGLTRYTYEPDRNRLTSITDPKGNKTALVYDSRGSLRKVENALGSIKEIAYDEGGRPVSHWDANRNRTDFTYDPQGQLSSMTDPLGEKVVLIRDTLGRVTEAIDNAGKATKTTYSEFGGVTSVTDARGNVTRFGYDFAAGRPILTEITDPRDKVTRFGHDSRGRRTWTTNPLGQGESLTYDETGALTSATNARGQSVSFEYDQRDRITAQRRPEGDTILEYNAGGKLTRASGPDSTANKTYDSAGLRAGMQETLPGGLSVSLSYSYDANGNRTGLTTPWGTYSYSYNALDRLTSITNPYGQTVLFTYDSRDKRTSIELPNGTATNYSYDAGGRIRQILHRKGTTALAFAEYGYDNAGNRVSLRDTSGTHGFSYDEIHRLTSASHPADTQLPFLNETFAYDAAGNRVADARGSGYLYDDANRNLQDAEFDYSYDASGNLTRKTSRSGGGSTNYSHDSQDRLTRIELPDGTVISYRYDVFGRRSERTVTRGTDTEISRYVYDGADILAILDGDNQLEALFTYIHGGEQPLIMRRGGQDFFYHLDGLHSPVALTNAQGDVVERVFYDAFGRAVFHDEASGNVSAASTVGNPFAFTGRELEADAGIYYYRERYYDPNIGRFIQEDMVFFTNPYAYVFNNPLGWTDSFGLMPGPEEALNGVFDERTTKEFLREASQDVGGAEGLKEVAKKAYAAHGGNMKYDFMKKANYKDLKFTVNGQELTAGQFGNYIAGYACTYAYGNAGYLGAQEAGEIFHVSKLWTNTLSHLPFVGKYFYDPDAVDAKFEIHYANGFFWIDDADSVTYVDEGRRDAFADRYRELFCH
ncbi:MAG: LamG-like jellyroll fold domain-containing protein [Elusimicrobiota bacterium]